MTRPLKISIITVAYNAANTIKDTIESVLSQSYAEIEYIVVDGKSTDETLAIVEQYKSQIATIAEPDKGIYDAMNKGIGLATGDIVGILNSDDFYADNTVIEQIAKMFTEDVDGVYADLVYVNQSNTDKVVRNWKSGYYSHGAFKKGWMPPHPTFFVRKSIYEKFGRYTLQLRSAADYEFMLRVIHKQRIKIKYLPQTIVKMRVGGESNASFANRLKANKEDRQAWKMNDLKPGIFTFIRKPLSKINQYFKK